MHALATRAQEELLSNTIGQDDKAILLGLTAGGLVLSAGLAFGVPEGTL